MNRKGQRGFTYIEASVCIAVVSLMAAICFPNVVRESSIRTHRLFKRSVVAIAVQARNRAIETRRTVSLSYNKGDQAIEVIEEDDTGASKPLPDLKLPDNVTTNQLFADKYESPSDGWRVPFYADGSTPGGGIEFQDDKETYSLIIDRFSAKATVVPGNLPDLSQQTWSAGGMQKRAQ